MARFAWWKEASPDARRALVAASFGWMLDSFDVMLYAMVLASLMSDLGIAKTTAGLLGSLTLVASAVGGLVFGVFADRFGRRKALMASILIYSIFTAACGFATGVVMLAVFRVFLGLGMGGEWASGASLVSETWPAEHRGKALGIVQSSWAIGYAAAAAVAALVLPALGLAGRLLRRRRSRVLHPVDPATGQRAGDLEDRPRGGAEHPGGLRRDLRPEAPAPDHSCHPDERLHHVRLVGLQPLAPGLPVHVPRSGRDRARSGSDVGTDHLHAGRDVARLHLLRLHQRPARPEEVLCGLPRSIASVFMLFYSQARHPLLLLFLGPFVAFFGTGYFTGFGALTAEIYPDVGPGHGPGHHLQHRTHRQRRGPLRRRLPGPDEGLRVLVRGNRRGLPRRRAVLDGDPGDRGESAGMIPGPG